MTSILHIRRARVEDAAALTAFAASIFAETFGSTNTPEDMQAYLAHSFSEARQAAEITDPTNIVLLAFEPGPDITQIVGYAHLGADSAPDVVRGAAPMELKRFYIATARHGSGLARQLMDETMAAASAQGAETLWLGVWEHNPRAIAFYRKFGFAEVGSHPFMLGQDVQTDILMAVDL
jgi:ribosomal protein S18 acetylase RimI-like enzyme